MSSKNAPTPGPWTWAKGWGDFVAGEEFEAEQKYLDLRLRGGDGSEILPLCIDHYATLLNGKVGSYLKPEDRALIASAPTLLKALKHLLGSYLSLANSGDCGFWNPETEAEVLEAREAIELAERSL